MLIFSFLILLQWPSQAQVWNSHAAIPPDGRENILGLSDQDLAKYVERGKIHAQIYPVEVTGELPAYLPIKNLLEDPAPNPFKRLLENLIQGFSGLKNFDDVMKSLGLHNYPQIADSGVYSVPYPNGIRPDYRMGFSTMTRDGALGFTYSCAVCHSANLFGKTVLGMTNRFPRANEFFVRAKQAAALYSPGVFAQSTGASPQEVAITNAAVENLKRVYGKIPLARGLDTSLAQVSLSLNRRTPDAWASPSKQFESHPRKDDFLDQYPADSKPAVWWNVKYKNRWLSDGSVVAGNPLLTNILWNEIGRGADLQVLSNWLSANQKVVDELTAAVFSIHAPRITDFFPADRINLSSARNGEKLFNNMCSRCHGTYQKAWNEPGSANRSLVDLIQTTKVIPKAITPVEDVGTDNFRSRGMNSLEKLNDLQFSKKYGIQVRHQDGYVPPPLVGIWARWPYMHNNSMPSLCEVLTPEKERLSGYYSGEANDPDTDFDFACNGYPTGSATPKAWKSKIWFYDNRKIGLSNSGHDEDIFVQNGINQLSRQDRTDLIQFLQTL